jgi:hypothetical protein
MEPQNTGRSKFTNCSEPNCIYAAVEGQAECKEHCVHGNTVSEDGFIRICQDCGRFSHIADEMWLKPVQEYPKKAASPSGSHAGRAGTLFAERSDALSRSQGIK